MSFKKIDHRKKTLKGKQAPSKELFAKEIELFAKHRESGLQNALGPVFLYGTVIGDYNQTISEAMKGSLQKGKRAMQRVPKWLP